MLNKWCFFGIAIIIGSIIELIFVRPLDTFTIIILNLNIIFSTSLIIYNYIEYNKIKFVNYTRITPLYEEFETHYTSLSDMV
jgi:hypothetical protein